MKKQLQKSLMLALLMIFGTASSWALTADLSMDYELAGYKAKAFYDLTSNDAGVMPESGDLRYREGWGLFDFGSGNRSGDVAIPVAENDLLVCQFADTQGRGATINSISGCALSTTLSDAAGHMFFYVNSAASTLTFNIGRGGCVVSILVMEKDESAATADYTLNYVYNSTIVKTVSATGAVGGTVLTEVSFFANDVKYFRADGEPESFTIAASGNNFTVNVREAGYYGYTLTDNTGATITVGSNYEGETVAVPYPRYQLKENTLYEAAATNKEFRKPITLTADNATATVEYAEKSGVNVVFYQEGEETSGFTYTTSGNIPVRASNAAAGVVTEDVTITSLEPGKYKLHVGIFASKTGIEDKIVNFGIGENVFAAGFSAVNLNEVASEEYTLNANTDVKFIAEGSWEDAQFDYIWIEKTGDVVINKAISLIPGPWSVDGATFAAYAWNEEGNAWFPFVNINGTGIYATQIPDTYTGIILARIDPKGTDENPWNNVWNQTADIDFTTIADQTVFTITGWGEGEGAKSTYTTATSVEAAKSILQRFVNVAKGLEIDTTDAEALLANDEATFEQLNDAIKTLLGSLQVKAKEIVAMLEEFFAKFDNKAATALTPYFATAEEALAGGDYIAMRAATMALAAKCLEEGKRAMAKVDSYLRKMEDETINADLDAINAAIASLSDTNGILGLIPFIQQLKDDMTPAVTTYLGKVGTLISEGAAAGKDVSAVQTAYNNVLTVAISYKSGSATLVDLGYALYNLIKAVEAYNDVEGIIPDGSYYVMSANEGTLINAEGALDAKGALITFTFDKANNAYTIEGADYFTGKQWTVANAIEGMSGYYTISTTEGFLAASATNTLEQIADGTADAAVWIILEKAYWEDIVNSTYTVAGTKNLTGTENDWDIAETNQMVLNDETGLFEKKFKRIAINAGNQPEFKVVQTNMEGENTWYPLGDGSTNWVITTEYVGGEGLYDITITFDPSDFKEIGVIADKRIVFPEDAIVYDFEAAADAGENPANKNGSAANGQAFYGWENPEKTDSKRQDYKGYEWAEGSVLPEECHVWRRSDRINGNVADNGGLKCPNNKEMAVDGLNEGDKVIIIYDAENATDKEIIWAIGDGTAEEGPGVVRATATINGVEAVTGETTIASGAEIVLNSVTPAENGTGYIVFQVKKGMIIKQIAIIQEGTTTGIASVNATAEQNAAGIYNLNGQKVEKAQKGLYIINGKKMVIR